MKINKLLRNILVEAGRYSDEGRSEYKRNRKRRDYNSEESKEFYRKRNKTKKRVEKTKVLHDDGTTSNIRKELHHMDPDLYEKRRKVMKILYEIKDLMGADYRRIKVRIAEFKIEQDLGFYKDANYLGLGGAGKTPNITLPIKMFSGSLLKLLPNVVYHEALHAFGMGFHIEESPLMNPYVYPTPLPKKDLQTLFMSHREHPTKKDWLKWWSENKNNLEGDY